MFVGQNEKASVIRHNMATVRRYLITIIPVTITLSLTRMARQREREREKAAPCFLRGTAPVYCPLSRSHVCPQMLRCRYSKSPCPYHFEHVCISTSQSVHLFEYFHSISLCWHLMITFIICSIRFTCTCIYHLIIIFTYVNVTSWCRIHLEELFKMDSQLLWTLEAL